MANLSDLNIDLCNYRLRLTGINQRQDGLSLCVHSHHSLRHLIGPVTEMHNQQIRHEVDQSLFIMLEMIAVACWLKEKLSAIRSQRVA